MPFFSEKFKSPLTRKINKNQFKTNDSAIKESPSIKLNLDGVESEFRNGQWITEKKSVKIRGKGEEEDLQFMVTTLKEEINLLKLKNEILLDMLAEGAVSNELQT